MLTGDKSFGIEAARTKRVLIIGAGAVGCALAATLLRHNVHVTLVARGATLAALRANGLRLRDEFGVYRLYPELVETLPDARADLLILALKAQQLPPLAAILAQRQELVVPVVNGIPFWFTSRGMAARELSPQDRLRHAISAHRLAGCGAYLMARLEAPGQVYCPRPPRLQLAALTQQGRAPLRCCADFLRAGGVEVDITADPSEMMWSKLLANAATNPLSVISHTTLRQISQDAGLYDCARSIAQEMVALGRAAGLSLPKEPAACLQAIMHAGDHITSMRQDFEAGRLLELEAICHAPLEMATRLGVAMPVFRTIVSLVHHAAETRSHGQSAAMPQMQLGA
ncbi:ketopantoate reductase family protein [Acidocella sp.]|uniref:ketopantoate reductase family protein n=1 Tax=Acidocella sp. TaxID=50710 RepID=UPI003D061204